LNIIVFVLIAIFRIFDLFGCWSIFFQLKTLNAMENSFQNPHFTWGNGQAKNCPAIFGLSCIFPENAAWAGNFVAG